MADVKDGDIVFEYPDDDEIPGSKLPDEKEVFIQKEKNEVKVETKADDIDLEITDDDVPAADRGKEPLPKEKVEELENDNLEDYSERVKQRMAQLKKVWHDERRAKEAADRLVQLDKQVMQTLQTFQNLSQHTCRHLQLQLDAVQTLQLLGYGSGYIGSDQSLRQRN